MRKGICWKFQIVSTDSRSVFGVIMKYFSETSICIVFKYAIANNFYTIMATGGKREIIEIHWCRNDHVICPRRTRSRAQSYCHEERLNK